MSFGFLSLCCSCHLALLSPPEESDYNIVEIPLGDIPDGVAVGGGYVWVTVPGSIRTIPPERGWLFKIDPSTNEIASRIKVGKRPEKVLWAAGSVWVLNRFQIFGEQEPMLMRIDPRTDKVSHAIPVGMTCWDMDADETSLWLVGGVGDIARLNFESMTLSTVRESTLDTSLDLSGVAVGAKSVWLLEGNWARADAPGKVYRLDPARKTVVATIPLGLRAKDIAFGKGAVWVVNDSSREERGTVLRIAPGTASAQATIPVGDFPFFLAVCEDAVWVTNAADGSVSRIDPESNLVTDVIRVPFGGRRLSCGMGSVWVTRETRNPRKGSLLRLSRRKT